ncbi:hypothetical protein PENSTE_c002G02385 [Penicillium steckii]|uniref:NAD(P)-binding domain-containing protein n=1 Tax=Penicillium steckii TaxID=303698 RepID=A0A1V6TTQ4_9EURO|nr:hypothetical protein PENSTE_c002G02385 [Penicillium steckii]
MAGDNNQIDNGHTARVFFKKILVLGATGPTGILTVQTALEHNHIVTIYARNRFELSTDISGHSNIKMIRGDLSDAEALSHAIQGQDIIVSLLGPSGSVVGTPFQRGKGLRMPIA